MVAFYKVSLRHSQDAQIIETEDSNIEEVIKQPQLFLAHGYPIESIELLYKGSHAELVRSVSNTFTKISALAQIACELLEDVYDPDSALTDLGVDDYVSKIHLILESIQEKVDIADLKARCLLE